MWGNYANAITTPKFIYPIFHTLIANDKSF